MSHSPALLEAIAVRIDIAASPVVEHLSVRADGERVVLAGPAAPHITAAIVGSASVMAGRLDLAGRDVATGQHFTKVGLAPIDPPLPSDFTVVEYVRSAFQLAGMARKEAEGLALRTLADLGLGALARRKCSTLRVHERRAAVVAQAMLPTAAAAFVETPLVSLEGTEAEYVLAVLGHAARFRRLLATAARFDPDSPERDLLLGADQICVVGPNAVWWAGPASDLLRQQRVLALRVSGKAHALVSALVTRECTVQGEPPRICVSLADRVDTGELFRIAGECDAVILEMLPVVGADSSR